MNILKKYSMAIVAVMIVIGFSAFKVGEKFHMQPADGWYDVTIDPSDPNDETKQTLSLSVGVTPPDIDQFGCAKTLNNGNRCSIYLSFGSNVTSVPSTVAAARSNHEITVGEDAKMPIEL